MKATASIPARPWAELSREERNSAVLALRAEGLSSGEIATKLTASRNAVIGYMKRLADAGVAVPGSTSRKPKAAKAPRPPRAPNARASRVPAAPKPPKAAKPTKAPKVLRKSAGGSIEIASMRGANNPHYNDFKGRAEQRAKSPGLSPALVAGVPVRPIEDIFEPPVSRRLALVALTERTCKWPSGDVLAEDFGFCGHDVAGTTYCAYHKRIAYLPPITRHRAETSAERKSA